MTDEKKQPQQPLLWTPGKGITGVPGPRRTPNAEIACLCGVCQSIFFASSLFVGSLGREQRKLPEGKIKMVCPNCGHTEICEDKMQLRIILGG